jgi:hypothetical protein
VDCDDIFRRICVLQDQAVQLIFGMTYSMRHVYNKRISGLVTVPSEFAMYVCDICL